MNHLTEALRDREKVAEFLRSMPIYSVQEKHVEIAEEQLILQAQTNVLLAAILDELQKGKK